MRSPSPTNVAEAATVLRAADSSDLDFVRDLCRRVFLVYGSYHEYAAEWFQTDEVATWIAEFRGIRSGFVMFTAPRTAELCDLIAIAVSPDVQSQGVGKTLLAKCLDVVRELPRVREVRLQVAEGNARAQRMFARSGFRFRPETGIYPAGQRALFMIKTLKREVS